MEDMVAAIRACVGKTIRERRTGDGVVRENHEHRMMLPAYQVTCAESSPLEAIWVATLDLPVVVILWF